MKKQTQRVIAMILSCLLICGGTTISAFAENNYNVTLIREPAENATYGKIYNKSEAAFGGVNEIPFRFTPDAGYTSIEVTTDYGEKVFSADAEDDAIEVLNDGSVMIRVNTCNISRVGDNTLTLSVNYEDGAWTKDYNIFVEPRYRTFTQDFSSVTTPNADNVGLTELKVNHANNTYTMEDVDGEYAMKTAWTANNNKENFLAYQPNISSTFDDYVFEYDFYADSSIKNSEIQVNISGKGKSETAKSIISGGVKLENKNWNGGCWYTFRYVIDVSEKSVSLLLVKDGVITDTVYTKDIRTDMNFFNEDGSFNLNYLKLSWYAVHSSASYYALDNIRFYRVVPTNNVLSYTEKDESVDETKFLNGKVSENADSITATFSSTITAKENSSLKINLYKGDAIVNSDAIVDGANITFSNLKLESGTEYTIKIENANIGSYPLNGFMEIPFETSDYAADVRGAASLSVENESSIKQGKVLNINAELYPGFETAGIYIDDTLVSNLEENIDNNYSVRHLIADDFSTGSHTLKLVAAYSGIDDVVITKNITVYGKDEAPDAYTWDFEEFTSLSDAGTSMSQSDIVNNLNSKIKWIHSKPKCYIYKDDQTASLSLKFNNETGAELGVANSYGDFYSHLKPDNTKAAYSAGRLSVEFDFYLNTYYASFMNFDLYATGDKKFNKGSSSIISNTKYTDTLGNSHTIESGWHKLKVIVDLDNMKLYRTLDGTQLETIAVEFGSTQNLYYYRIGISTLKDTYWAIDNIKTSYLGSALCQSVEYVKNSESYEAEKIFAYDADRIKLNVSKEFANFNAGDVTVSVNDAEYKNAQAEYSDGSIYISMTDLDIKKGDNVTFCVSHNAYLTDGTQVDEQIKVNLMAADSDMSLIVVDGVSAKAYFRADSESDINAVVYLACYKDGELILLDEQPVKIKTGEAIYEIPDLAVSQECTLIKCMAWNGVAPIIPNILK